MSDDDDVRFSITNTGIVCLTVAVVVLIVCSFGSCLLYQRAADHRIRCIELMHDVATCSEAFEGPK